MAATAAFPTLCEVAIICAAVDAENDNEIPERSGRQRTHSFTQVIPAGVRLVKLIDAIRDSINDELDERGEPQLPAANYELRAVGGRRLDPKRTLQELGVANGDALVLVPAEAGESYVPQYEELSTGLARLGKKLVAAVNETIAAKTALAILTLAALVVAAIAGRARTFTGDTFTEALIPAAVVGVGGLVLAAMAIAAANWWPDQHDIIDTLAWLACGLLTMCGYVIAPGQLGAPHLVIAGLAAVVSVGATARFTGRHTTAATAVIAVCVIAAVSVGLRWWRPVPGQVLGLITLVVLLLGIFYTERIALRVCAIRPPHFGSVTGKDIFDALKGALTRDTVTPVDNTDIDPTPSGERIGADAVRLANVMSGLCIAYAVALPPAIWAVLAPGKSYTWHALVVAVLFVSIFITRARSFVAAKQAVPLVVGACVATLAGVVKYVLAAPGGDTTALVAATGTVFAFGLCALGAAVIVPHTRFMPPIRVAVEWFELVAIAVSVPLMAWIGGLFTWLLYR